MPLVNVREPTEGGAHTSLQATMTRLPLLRCALKPTMCRGTGVKSQLVVKSAVVKTMSC